MFSRFTRNEGRHTFFVRVDHLIAVLDTTEGCMVVYHEGDDVARVIADGTAQDNFERLQAEEIALMDAARERERRAQGGLPLLPVPRGKVR